ncbi:hypothetical protein BJ322DRAFT_1192956 [Thelephora terrestris]|uniref:Uncharacterized protein n=1 Tax=Thelephora terrestris TaxID=56493 RepID=A0A9P6HFH4_9AGAM|nr:hypothetical protein BJ322DRAFT_1192956 [Thelephora terrestris]
MITKTHVDCSGTLTGSHAKVVSVHPLTKLKKCYTYVVMVTHLPAIASGKVFASGNHQDNNGVKKRKSRKLEKATIIWGRAQIPRVSLSRSGLGASNEGEWGVARRRLVRWSCSGGTHRIQRLNGSSKSSRAKALMRRAKPTSCSLTDLRISKYPNHTDRFGGGDDGSVGSEFSEVDSAELRESEDRVLPQPCVDVSSRLPPFLEIGDERIACISSSLSWINSVLQKIPHCDRSVSS